MTADLIRLAESIIPKPVSVAADAPFLIPAVFVLEALEGVRHQGLAVGPLLEAAGIDPDLPLDLDHHVSATQYARLLRRAMAALNDETMGLFTRKLRKGSYALMASTALNGADSLVGALDQFLRTLGLMQDDLVPVLEDDGRHVRAILRFSTASVARRPFVHGLLLRLMWRLMSWLDTGKLRAERVELAFARPPHGEFYLNIFPTELVFDASHSAIWFQSSRMQGPVRRDARALADYLEKAVLDMVVPVIATRYADRVRAFLQLERTRHGQWPDLEQSARALHCSPSSLQRHLAKEKASFQGLRDHLRRDWAIYRLQTSEVTTLALAQELGFSDEASFQRAFKRWTGHPPGKLRKRRP